MKMNEWILLDLLDYCEAGYRYNILNDAVLQSKKPYRLEIMQHTNDFGFCSFEEKRLVIDFNGSDDIKDWINNLRFLKLTQKIHIGFLLSIQKFYDNLEKYISEYKSNHQEGVVQFVGQSRGGALAQLGAYFCADQMKTPCRCVTYGSPMVGGNEYRDETRGLPIHFTEVINGNDLVTNLPPKGAGFEHAGYIFQLPLKAWHLIPLPSLIAKKHKCPGYRKALESYFTKYKNK